MLALLNNCFSPKATGCFFRNGLRNYATKNTIAKKKSGLEDQALRLIFGAKAYEQFNRREKRIVDAYQKWIDRQDGGLTLPNTKKSQEVKRCQELFTNSLTPKE